MRFDYETKKDDRECVAYIDGCGDIRIKVDHTHIDDVKCVCIEDDGFFHFNLDFDPSDATQKFYPGDKLTITF